MPEIASRAGALANSEAIVFDAYGTLFDVHSVTRLAESLYPGKGAALSQAWRVKQLEYTWLRTLMGRYEDFNAVTAAALAWVVEAQGLDRSADAQARLVAEYRRLATFPEVKESLALLGASRGLAIFSNGHPEMLQALVDHNGLGATFGDRVLSVHDARLFKPHPSVYALVVERLGIAAGRIGFVSSNGWDAAGAKAFGFSTVWVNRGGAPVEKLGAPPDAMVKDLREIAAVLG
jgi:2-haloacid dehalogenase